MIEPDNPLPKEEPMKTPGEVVLEHFHAPDATHASWWINTDEMTEALKGSDWLAAEKADAWVEGYKARTVLDITGDDINPYRAVEAPVVEPPHKFKRNAHGDVFETPACMDYCAVCGKHKDDHLLTDLAKDKSSYVQDVIEEADAWLESHKVTDSWRVINRVRDALVREVSSRG